MNRISFENLLLKDPMSLLADGFPLKNIVPELAALAPDSAVTVKNLHKDNLTHSVQVVANLPLKSSLRLRWAALYHDVGKAPTRRIEGGHVTFQGHEVVGSRLTMKRLKALGYDQSFIDDVSLIVEISGRISSFSSGAGGWTDAAVRRMAKDLRDDPSLINDALDLVAADCTSKHERNRIAARNRAEGFRQALADVRTRDAQAARRPPLDGIAVMRILGLSPSKDVAIALRWLLENHEHSTPDEAEEALVTWWPKARG
jgi:poly(A) polymerase